MRQVCEISGKIFDISEAEIEFYSILDSQPPKKSPSERNRRRMSFRNFMGLYHTQCALSGTKIISMYRPESGYISFSPESWWSDNWNAKDYCQDYNFDESLNQQFGKLMKKVPRLATVQFNSENCLYTNFTLFSNNCYLVFGCVKSEDCHYGHIVWESNNCLDCLYAFQSQWCAYCVDIAGCYEVFYSIETINCRNGYFLYDCKNCQDCFACFNLRNKQYCILNKQYSKEEYKKKISELLPLSRNNLNKMELWLSNIIKSKAYKPESFSNQSEDISGNHIYNCKNIKSCFDIKKSIDSSYIYTGLDISNSLDLSFVGAANSFCLDSVTLTRCERVIHSHYCIDCSDLSYCDYCVNSKNLFGCTGLKNSQYCILNKQYSKEEYLKLKTRIIEKMKSCGEYGEFFSPSICPFSYNEASAQDYAPLKKEEAEELGYSWKDSEEELLTITSSHLLCQKSKKPFKITKQESDFLLRYKLPDPIYCFKQRHADRMSLREARELIESACCNCNKKVESSHKLRVLCEDCYQLKMAA